MSRGISKTVVDLYSTRAISIDVVQKAFYSNDSKLIQDIIRLLLRERDLSPLERLIEQPVRDFFGINQGPRRVNPDCSYLLDISPELAPEMLDFIFIIRTTTLNCEQDFEDALQQSPVQQFLMEHNRNIALNPHYRWYRSSERPGRKWDESDDEEDDEYHDEDEDSHTHDHNDDDDENGEKNDHQASSSKPVKTITKIVPATIKRQIVYPKPIPPPYIRQPRDSRDNHALYVNSVQLNYFLYCELLIRILTSDVDKLEYWLVPSIHEFLLTLQRAEIGTYVNYKKHLTMVCYKIILSILSTSNSFLLQLCFFSMFNEYDLGFGSNDVLPILSDEQKKIKESLMIDMFGISSYKQQQQHTKDNQDKANDKHSQPSKDSKDSTTSTTATKPTKEKKDEKQKQKGKENTQDDKITCTTLDVSDIYFKYHYDMVENNPQKKLAKDELKALMTGGKHRDADAYASMFRSILTEKKALIILYFKERVLQDEVAHYREMVARDVLVHFPSVKDPFSDEYLSIATKTSVERQKQRFVKKQLREASNDRESLLAPQEKGGDNHGDNNSPSHDGSDSDSDEQDELAYRAMVSHLTTIQRKLRFLQAGLAAVRRCLDVYMNQFGLSKQSIENAYILYTFAKAYNHKGLITFYEQRGMTEKKLLDYGNSGSYQGERFASLILFGLSFNLTKIPDYIMEISQHTFVELFLDSALLGHCSSFCTPSSIEYLIHQKNSIYPNSASGPERNLFALLLNIDNDGQYDNRHEVIESLYYQLQQYNVVPNLPLKQWLSSVLLVPQSRGPPNIQAFHFLFKHCVLVREVAAFAQSAPMVEQFCGEMTASLDTYTTALFRSKSRVHVEEFFYVKAFYKYVLLWLFPSDIIAKHLRYTPVNLIRLIVQLGDTDLFTYFLRNYIYTPATCIVALMSTPSRLSYDPDYDIAPITFPEDFNISTANNTVDIINQFKSQRQMNLKLEFFRLMLLYGDLDILSEDVIRGSITIPYLIKTSLIHGSFPLYHMLFTFGFVPRPQMNIHEYASSISFSTIESAYHGLQFYTFFTNLPMFLNPDNAHRMGEFFSNVYVHSLEGLHHCINRINLREQGDDDDDDDGDGDARYHDGGDDSDDELDTPEEDSGDKGIFRDKHKPKRKHAAPVSTEASSSSSTGASTSTGPSDTASTNPGDGLTPQSNGETSSQPQTQPPQAPSKRRLDLTEMKEAPSIASLMLGGHIVKQHRKNLKAMRKAERKLQRQKNRGNAGGFFSKLSSILRFPLGLQADDQHGNNNDDGTGDNDDDNDNNEDGNKKPSRFVVHVIPYMSIRSDLLHWIIKLSNVHTNISFLLQCLTLAEVHYAHILRLFDAILHTDIDLFKALDAPPHLSAPLSQLKEQSPGDTDEHGNPTSPSIPTTHIASYPLTFTLFHQILRYPGICFKSLFIMYKEIHHKQLTSSLAWDQLRNNIVMFAIRHLPSTIYGSTYRLIQAIHAYFGQQILYEQNIFGDNPLFLSARLLRVDIFSYLLAASPKNSLSHKDVFGRTILMHLAAPIVTNVQHEENPMNVPRDDHYTILCPEITQSILQQTSPDADHNQQLIYIAHSIHNYMVNTQTTLPTFDYIALLRLLFTFDLSQINTRIGLMMPLNDNEEIFASMLTLIKMCFIKQIKMVGYTPGAIADDSIVYDYMPALTDDNDIDPDGDGDDNNHHNNNNNTPISSSQSPSEATNCTIM